MPLATSGGSPLIVVSNTTPLSELAKIGQLSLLRDVFDHILIPPEVSAELTAGVHPAAGLISQQQWIEVKPVSNPQAVLTLHYQTKLGLGECAAIILAEEVGAHRLLLDDRNARQQAHSRSLPVLGTVGVILVAKNLGLIPTVKDVLDALIAQGMRLGPQLYQAALATAGE